MATHFVMNSNHIHLTWQLDIETVKEADGNVIETYGQVLEMQMRDRQT